MPKLGELYFNAAIGWLLFRPVLGACPTMMAENLVRCLPVYWGSAPWNSVWRLLLHFCGVCLVVLALVAFVFILYYCLQGFWHFLSIICFLGIIPACSSLNIIALYARVSSSYLWSFMGSTSIALLSISTITMMYLLPRCEHVGNCTVWSENTLFLTSYTLMYMSRAFFPWSVAVFGTSRGICLGLVDLIFFLIGSDGILAYRWSLGNICRCSIWSASAILRSYPLLWFGYPQTTWIHMIASSLDGRSYTLCAIRSCLLDALLVLCGCHCLWSWVNGIQYLPRSSLLPMRMCLLWHVMSTSPSLWVVTPYFVKIDTLPLSAVLPTLIIEVGNS